MFSPSTRRSVKTWAASLTIGTLAVQHVASCASVGWQRPSGGPSPLRASCTPREAGGIGTARRASMRTALLLGGRRCRLPLSAWPTAQFCRRALLAALVLLAVAGCGGGDQAREPSASAPASTRASTPAASTDSSPDSGVAAPSHPATRSSEPAAPPSSTNPGPTATAPTAPGFPASLAGQDIERIPTRSKIIALTFDAGANADAVG